MIGLQRGIGTAAGPIADQTMPTHPARLEVLALLTGQVRAFSTRGPSAIAKKPITGPVAITALGLVGDKQADPVHHGGADKAIHHYPFDHYAFWREQLGDHPLLAMPGGFGENISTHGLTEQTVRLGDRFRLGTALIEVSHGRQPCWKLGHHFGHAALAAQVLRNGYAGWYYRVLEPGVAETGDRLDLVEAGLADWTLARLFAVLVAKHPAHPALLRELAALPVLAEEWRMRATKLLRKS